MKKTYKKRLGIFRNSGVQQYIKSLDPIKDNCELVYFMSSYSFYSDLKRALELALFRTFASPNISKLLDKTGEFQKRGQRRYDDTALLIFAFVQAGYDSPEGIFAIEHMNKIHGFFDISNEDYLYVLSTFILGPIDWIEEFGWRKFYDNEKIALHVFFRQVGIRMHLTDIPETIEDFRQWALDYEKKYFKPTQSNINVAAATIDIVKGWLPRFLRFLVQPTVVSLMDKRLREAFDYKPPSRFFSGLIRGLMWVRKQCLKVFVLGKYPTTLENVYARSYPKGFDIDQLGPPSLIQKESNDKTKN